MLIIIAAKNILSVNYEHILSTLHRYYCVCLLANYLLYATDTGNLCLFWLFQLKKSGPILEYIYFNFIC